MLQSFLARFPLTRQVIVRDRGRQALRLHRIPRCRRNKYDVGILPDIQSLDQFIRRLIQLFGFFLLSVGGLRTVVIRLTPAGEAKPFR